MVSHHQQTVLILTAVFGVASICLMILRLAFRKCRGQDLYWSDYLTIVAILCAVARIAIVPVVILWHSHHEVEQQGLTETEIYQYKLAAKLLIANRLIYNTYLWIQKAVILLLFHQMFACLLAAKRLMRIIWAVLLLSYVVVQVVCFVDCIPTRLYWQILPSRDDCTQAIIQLATFVALNMATDIVLIIFPMPWICSLKQYPLKRRAGLIGIFSLGIVLTVVALIRLPAYNNSTSQFRRYIWGSVEQFGAALVANIPTLYSLRKRTAPGDAASVSTRSKFPKQSQTEQNRSQRYET
ncbi:hypothetical protein BDV10DRAFT_177736 [Aspergillus recurvatus]